MQPYNLRCVDEDDFAVLKRDNLQHFDIFDRRTVARVHPHAVDLDRAFGRDELAAPRFAKRIFGCLTGFERGGDDTRIGADRQASSSLAKPEASVTKRPARSPFGKGRAPQAWLLASAGRLDPDLEKRGRLVFEIVFRMRDAGARRHHLHVAGLRAAVIAELSSCVMAPLRT